MRIGVSLRSNYLPTDPARLGARLMIERAAAARAAGLDSLFVGDHHVMRIPYYQNSAILGRLLAEWGDAPAGALYLLPLWNPVLLAEQVGTLASIAAGRFIVQCALGDGEEQFAGMGVELQERVARFESSLDLVRRLLAGEVVTSGPPWPVSGARICPVPPEPVELWIGGRARRAVDRAARLGDGFVVGPEPTDAEAAQLAALYRERCEAHGRAPAVVAIRRDIHVGADADDAARVATPILARGYRGLDLSSCVVGGPSEVAERFAGYAAMGYTDVLVRHLADEQADVLASFSRLGGVRETVHRI